jgi:hypothetical protein
MPSAAAATPRSSLEAMLETIRKRDVQAEDAVPFLPPLPARPRCRGRPPTNPTPRRRSLPPGFKLGNGEAGVGAGAVPVDEAADVATGGATISTDGAAAGVVHPAVKIAVDDPRSRNAEPPRVRAEGSREMSGTELEPARGRWWRCF